MTMQTFGAAPGRINKTAGKAKPAPKPKPIIRPSKGKGLINK